MESPTSLSNVARLANLVAGIGSLSITYGLSHLGSGSTSVLFVLFLFLVWLGSGFLGIGLVIRAIFAGKGKGNYSWENPKFLTTVAGILFLVLVTKVMFGLNKEETSTTPSSTQLEAERHQEKMEELDRELASLRAKQYEQEKINIEAQRLSDDLRLQGVGVSPAEARALLQTEKDLADQ